MTPDLAPETLVDGRYRIQNRLGSGGMADVFCAEDVQLGRKVALKLLHRRFAADAEFVERFRREAQSAAGLQHPNVVSVYDRGQWDGTYYIAMEHLAGRNLKELIRAEAPVEPVRAIDIVVHVLKAARFAHKRGIIHRDLKPHNVIVEDDDRVKVTDFGIARAGASDMTETGSILGTAQYLSPEQAQGHAVSAQSDLYSVGVILYELLTGKLPFEADSAVTIALKHVSETPAAPTALNPAIPPGLEAIVLWALEKDPARRPADADALIDALEDVRARIVAGEPGQETTAFIAPLPVSVPGPPTAATEVAAEPAAVVAHEPVVPLLVEDPEPERRRGWGWLAALALLLLLAGGGVAAYLLTRPEKIAVPQLVGQNETAATTLLQNKGLTPNVVPRTSPKSKGTVIGQSPLAGETLHKGDTVTLTVSSGPGQGTVPSVQGLPRAKAEAKLRQAGFRVTTQTENSDSVPRGNVISVMPDPGSQIDKGSTVTLVVSSGQALVRVPTVIGKDVNSARNSLASAGFTNVSTSEQESTKTPGTVLSQSPSGGSSVAKGASVTLTVAKEGKVKVPDVVGQSQTEAGNALSRAGFSPVFVTKKVIDVTQDGKVLKQTPSGGTPAAKGATVTLVVAKFVPPLTPGNGGGGGNGNGGSGTGTGTGTTPTTTNPTP